MSQVKSQSLGEGNTFFLIGGGKKKEIKKGKNFFIQICRNLKNCSKRIDCEENVSVQFLPWAMLLSHLEDFNEILFLVQMLGLP
jgi:hypothetical protein